MLFNNKKNGNNEKTKAKDKAEKNNRTEYDDNASVSNTEAAKVKSNNKGGEIKGYMRAIPVILVAFALFTTICLVTGNEVGSFGSFFADFLKGLFSYMAYVIPLLMVLHAIFFFSDVKGGRVLSRIIFSALILITLAEVAYVIPSFSTEELSFNVREFYENGKQCIGGGFFGGVIGYALMKVIGKIGVIIVSLLVVALYGIYSFSGDNSALKRAFLKGLATVANFGARIEKNTLNRREQREKDKIAKKNAISEKKAAELMDDEFFSANNGLSSLEIPELGICENKNSGVRESFIKLRTTVSDTAEEDIIPKSSSENRTYGDFDENDGEFIRTESTEFKSDDIVFESKPREEKSETKAPARNPYGLDDSAEAVFTAEFDPYDLATNEKYASKPSSRAHTTVINNEKSGSFSETINELTPEQLERQRRNAEFEQRKRELLKRKAEAEAAAAKAEEERAREEARIREEIRLAEERRAEEERIARELREKEKEEQLIDDLAKIVDYSDFGSENESFNASFKATNPFRFSEDVCDMDISDDDTGSEASSDTNSDITDDYDTSYDYDSQGEGFSEPEIPYIRTEAVDGEDDIEEIAAPQTLNITRQRLEPGANYTVGLDFDDEELTVYDEEDEEDSDEPYEEGMEESYTPVEIPTEEQNQDINKFRSMFDMFGGDGNGDDNTSDEPTVTDNEDDIVDEYEDNAEEELTDDEPPFEEPKVKAEPKPKKKPDYSNYKFPPIDFLKPGAVEDSELINEEIQRNSDKLISTLESFGITATIRGIERGPRITRYSVVPAKGIRVNLIEKLADDIAMALAAESIRIEAPIPGKSAVGIEVPNKVSSVVSLRDLIEAEEFTSNSSKTAVCIGKSVEGSSVYGDLSSMPHLLIAGATGMGKSVCINSLIMSMLYKARPDEVKFIMIDPKKVEFAPYSGIPHLLVPVVTEPKDAAGALSWAVDEMNKRYEIMQKLSTRTIESYNEKVKENPALGSPIPKIIIFIDELNDLMIQVRDPVENLIMSIAQKARAAGIHLVIGTQRPSVNVITGVIKANIPSRIACKVSSGIDSRTILEKIGAEKLIGKGDMLYAPSGTPSPRRVQGAFVSEKETERIVEFVRSQAKGNVYDEEAIEEMRRATQKCDKSRGDDDEDEDDGEAGFGYLHDRKFLQAVELAIRNGSVATSFLQRKLHVGYGKAAQYIDVMEDLGIVGEKNGSKARDVLISMQEWNEKLSRLTDDI